MKDRQQSKAEAVGLIGVQFEDGMNIDGMLSSLADILAKDGKRVSGLIQIRGQAEDNCKCREMHLRDLMTGEQHLISEKRGPEAQGCHLDWQAMANLAEILEKQISYATDLLIVNRFGRAESEGRGFRSAIENAMSLGIPAIIALREQYRPEWEAFHGGLAETCRPNLPEMLAVARSQVDSGVPELKLGKIISKQTAPNENRPRNRSLLQ